MEARTELAQDSLGLPNHSIWPLKGDGLQKTKYIFLGYIGPLPMKPTTHLVLYLQYIERIET